MRRRDFLKGALGSVAATVLAPSVLRGDIIPDDGTKPLPSMADVEFDATKFAANDPQTIVVFLGGGMSDVVGNIQHIDQIRKEALSYSKYPDEGLTPTANGFWKEAGGDFLERMFARKELNVFRTCYQTDRIQAHGINQKRYMHGNDRGYDSGLVTTLLHVLEYYDAISEDAKFVNVAIDGGNERLLNDFAMPRPLRPFLRPVSFNRDFSNPYNYKIDERDLVDLGDYSANTIFNEAGFDGRLNALMLKNNHYDALSDVFNKRREISGFIEERRTAALPVAYPDTIDGRKFETAMRILSGNPDTKVVTINGGHSGWDDHSNALPLHRARAYELFEAIDAAMRHADAIGRDNLNIVLFGDFGRNMNLNSTGGWDHGNNQVVYWFGGKRFFNHFDKPMGETILDERYIASHRLYSRPAENAFQFRPYSIAATIYALYGIKNPEILTGGYGVIDPSSHGFSTFLKS